MDIKPRPNHQKYLEILRGMTGEQRLNQAFAMYDFALNLFKQGLRKRFPDLGEEELHKVFLARLEKCHNRNY